MLHECVCACVQFAMGRRDCVGRNFALQEGVTLLALLNRKFDFTLSAGYSLQPITQGFVQGMRGGLPVTVHLRK